MKCANCAKDNPAGARYCVHCGAEQSVPTPIAAVAAAAMGLQPRGPVRQAANAAQADPISVAEARLAVRHEPEPWPGSTAEKDQTSSSRPPAAVADVPAYASGPARTQLAAMLLGACLVLAFAAFAAWQLLRDNGTSADDGSKLDNDGSVMSSFPPEATPRTARRPGVEAPPPGQASAGAVASASLPEANAGNGTSARSADVAASQPAPSTVTAPATPVEIQPLPPKPTPRTARRAPVEKTPTPAQAPTQPAPTPGPPVAEPAPSRAPAVASAAKASPVVDRWTRMTDELARCTREDFITRVICDQRVRLRYCDGYWGKATQCPGAPAIDRGQ